MSIIYINRQGIMEDIKSHIRDNRRLYLFGCVLFLVCLFFGVRTGIIVVNPYLALLYYNENYYNLVNVIGENKYVVSMILYNMVSMFFVFLCTQHYFTTPLSIVVLIQRMHNFAITITLIFRIFNFGAIIVSILAIIPFSIISIGFLLHYSVFMYRMAQYCYRYGDSSFVIFEIRKIIKRLILYVILLIIISIVGGGLTILLASSVI